MKRMSPVLRVYDFNVEQVCAENHNVLSPYGNIEAFVRLAAPLTSHEGARVIIGTLADVI